MKDSKKIYICIDYYYNLLLIISIHSILSNDGYLLNDF